MVDASSSPMSHETRHSFLSVEGMRLHWAELGEASQRVPVVLLHGLNDSYLTWQRVAPELAVVDLDPLDLVDVDERIAGSVVDEKTAAARADYLARACGDNAKLRLRVERLLIAHPQAIDFLAQPALERGQVERHDSVEDDGGLRRVLRGAVAKADDDRGDDGGGEGGESQQAEAACAGRATLEGQRTLRRDVRFAA